MKTIFTAIWLIVFSTNVFSDQDLGLDARVTALEEVLYNLVIDVDGMESLTQSVIELQEDELKMSMYGDGYRVAYTNTGSLQGRVFTEYNDGDEYYVEYGIYGREGYLAVNSGAGGVSAQHGSLGYGDDICLEPIIRKSTYEGSSGNYYIDDEINYITSSTCATKSCHSYMHEVDIKGLTYGPTYSKEYDFESDDDICVYGGHDDVEYYPTNQTLEIYSTVYFNTYYMDELPDSTVPEPEH